MVIKKPLLIGMAVLLLVIGFAVGIPVGRSTVHTSKVAAATTTTSSSTTTVAPTSSTTSAPTTTTFSPADPIGQQARHEPGEIDVTTTAKGQPFLARPNFQYINKSPIANDYCDRPCYLPLFFEPKRHPEAEADARISDTWPCEYYDTYAAAAHKQCTDHDDPLGDQVLVVCQVQGEATPNAHNEESLLWDMVFVPTEHAQNTAKFKPDSGGKGYFAFTEDIWLGNTGDHGIPCPPVS